MSEYKDYFIDYYSRKDDTFPCCYDNLIGNYNDIDAVSKALNAMNLHGFECAVISFNKVDEDEDGSYPFTSFYKLTKSTN